MKLRGRKPACPHESGGAAMAQKIISLKHSLKTEWEDD